jgi:hypothetical protein
MATCANHPQTGAAAYCRTCGKPLCEQCKRDVRGVIYCEECLAARVGDPAMAGAVPPPPIPPAPAGGANPVLAALLGFIPGVGAMFNGQFVKALVHVGIFILLIKLTDETNGLFGIGIAAWVFYMAFDAYHTARARQLGLPAPDFIGINRLFGIKEDPRYAAAPVAAGEVAEPQAETHDRGVPAGAYWLIGLGCFFLLVNSGLFEIRWGRFLWEFVVIGVGIYLGFGRWTGTTSRRRGFCTCARCRMRYMTGPAMMITVGVLGLLAATHILPWRNSWPLFLIVLGAIRLAQMSASTEGHIEYVPPVPGAQVPPPPPPATEPNSTTTGGV